MNTRGIVTSLIYALAKMLSDGLFWDIVRNGLEKLREKIVASENKVDDAALPLLDSILAIIPDKDA